MPRESAGYGLVQERVAELGTDRGDSTSNQRDPIPTSCDMRDRRWLSCVRMLGSHKREFNNDDIDIGVDDYYDLDVDDYYDLDNDEFNHDRGFDRPVPRL